MQVLDMLTNVNRKSYSNNSLLITYFESFQMHDSRKIQHETSFQSAQAIKVEEITS